MKDKEKSADQEPTVGPTIEPLRVGAGASVDRFVTDVFARSGFNARRLGEACQLASRMLDLDAMVCLTLAGAMTPIGMSGPIASLIEAGFIDAVVSTGANIYHDLHRPFDCPMYQGDWEVDDDALAATGIARIYDTFIEDSATLMATDEAIIKAFDKLPHDRPVSSADLHFALGNTVKEQAAHPEKSFIAAAAQYDVPVFASAPGDSSVAMNMVAFHLFGRKILLDPVRDVVELTALVRLCETTGGIIVGGGSPKNFFLQTQPTLEQILRDTTKGGHDFMIQLTVDAPHWGGLSGATPSEARSWGKVKKAHRNNVVVYSCASITLPILAEYLLARNKPRKHKRLMRQREEAIGQMREAALKNPELRRDYRGILDIS